MWLATGFKLGFSPILPGTCGAIWGVPLAWVFAQFGWLGFVPGLVLQVLAIVAVNWAGIPVCTRVARQFGVKDPGFITLDEITSLPITYFLVPLPLMNHPGVLAAGFLLHRVFDIVKPPPAPQLERLPEGLGIMADDWSAGVYSCLCLHGLIWWGVFAS